MIFDPTDEMIEAVESSTPHLDDAGRRRMVARVLALVERDYRLDKICREQLMPDVYCARPRHDRGDHEARMRTGSVVKWS